MTASNLFARQDSSPIAGAAKKKTSPPIPITSTSTSTPLKRKRASPKSPPNVVTPDPHSSQSMDIRMDSQIPVVVDLQEALSDGGFEDLQVPPCELRPSATLTTGQCFHWKAIIADLDDATAHNKTSAWGTHDATQWIGTLRTPSGDSIVLLVRETPETTLYKVLYAPPTAAVDIRTVLHQYFQLDHSLASMYEKWSENCPRLERIAKCIPGVRILEQDPWECLVSFLCSSNNNIPRIAKILASIRRTYGQPLIRVGEETLYSFPSLTDMRMHATDQDLRERCGLGYRAKYLMGTLALLTDEASLTQLRIEPCADRVQERLLEFPGVGRKVADCVALFSLRQTEAIPVDVHVMNVARRDYFTDKEKSVVGSTASMTPTVYRLVGNLFRNRFPTHSGWAHSLLFVAELPSFRPVLPADLLEEMDRFRRDEEQKKKVQKAAKKKKKEESD
jgi:N-glycosylase/DNA lyase